jgi:hypothetical protein
VFRWDRAAKLVRILRVMRGFKSPRTIAHFLAGTRAKRVSGVRVLCLLMIVSCSIAVLHFEVPAGGNIATAEDAL